MKFILRLFPEISIKSRPVRNRLIKLLTHNLTSIGQAHNFDIHVQAQWDKVIARFGDSQDYSMRDLAIRELSRVPGIHSFLEVEEYSFSTLEDIFDAIKDKFGPQLEGKTFAVRVRRRGNHEFTSQLAERNIGGMFKAHYKNNGVNLTNPELQINIEIDQNKAYIITDRHMGIGGYPVGSQGEVLTLISGGFDSGVSTYDAIRRGLKTHYLFFNMGGNAHELGVKQESYYIWNKYHASHKVKFITVPFEEIVGNILEKTHHGVRGVILKRMMMRVGGIIAKKIGADALVTGESVGQVSSQTLINLNHIDSVAPCLVLRPLAMSDKQDIVDKAKEIGTAPFADSMPEYCGVISDHPNVCPTAEFILEEEAKMAEGLVQRAVENAKFMDIREVPEDTKRLEEDIEIVKTVKVDDVILDVRSPDDAMKAPIKSNNEVILMPFYKVANNFHTLDKKKTYALYCDQGVMSITQTKQLKEMGYHNVKVWRPQEN